MARSHRATWSDLSPTWKRMLRDAEGLPREPGPRDLATLFATPTLSLQLPARSRRLDLAPLRHFRALEALDLSEGIDLDTLPVLPKLTSLSVHAPSMPDDLGARVPALESMTLVPMARHARALRGIQATSVEVIAGDGMNLAVLAQMPRLRTLVMSDGPPEQVPQLAAFGHLTELDLRYTKLTDLTPLAALVGLHTLGLACTEVSDLGPLAGLTGLRSLSLFACKAVDDLAPLAGLHALRTLDLTSTAVRDLAPIAALAGLETLRLDDTKITTLDALRGLASLTELGAPSTAVRRLDPLASLTRLVRSTSARRRCATPGRCTRSHGSAR
ncbi:MAG: hypothetical protein U0325_07955 [Polyangiales bacterium]